MSDLKTCFKAVDYDLSSLLNYIDIGDIGLPDILLSQGLRFGTLRYMAASGSRIYLGA